MTLSLSGYFSQFWLPPATSSWILGNGKICLQTTKKPKNYSFPVSCSLPKVVQSPSVDKHVVKVNKIRFVQKLKTLLLYKPKHYIPLHVLAKCQSYLGLPKPRSILSMTHRYPTIFELFTTPMPPIPFNATKSGYQLCVRLTTTAAALATQEMNLKSAVSITLANKAQKLPMLSSHRRLLLSKLVHIAPDLGLRPNFCSRLCNDCPDKFKIVDTTYGQALELESWDQELACPLPSPKVTAPGLIVDRPLKFKHLRLRKGLNLKRCHRDFLIKFGELLGVCPYNTPIEELAKESLEAEKRACALMRKVLAMMVEKRTLIDHLTHFRKDFGLPHKLRAMILRHPELFYVSLKGLRNSVLLVECFNDKVVLLEEDETLVIKEKLMEMIREAKRMRRERRKHSIYGNYIYQDDDDGDDEDHEDGDNDECDYDGFENLFDSEDSDPEYYFDDEISEIGDDGDNGEFWIADASSVLAGKNGQCIKPW